MATITIRKLLNDEGFDWQRGEILYQTWPSDTPGWGAANVPAHYITQDDVILDLEFDDGYGGPDCPRFLAKDGRFLYFPVQYDGATWIDKMAWDLDWYCEIAEPMRKLPYPGGG